MASNTQDCNATNRHPPRFQHSVPIIKRPAYLNARPSIHPILLVSGTRPEIIKLAPLYQALRETSWVDAHWLHTGQHADMASQIMASFDITPDIALMR